jgi:hypothetical protein
MNEYFFNEYDKLATRVRRQSALVNLLCATIVSLVFSGWIDLADGHFVIQLLLTVVWAVATGAWFFFTIRYIKELKR